MKPFKRNEKQEFVILSKRTIFVSLACGIILLFLTLYSFLRGGWFAILGVILIFGFFGIVGYAIIMLIMLYVARNSTTVEKHVSQPAHPRHIFSKQQVSWKLEGDLGREKRNEQTNWVG